MGTLDQPDAWAGYTTHKAAIATGAADLPKARIRPMTNDLRSSLLNRPGESGDFLV